MTTRTLAVAAPALLAAKIQEEAALRGVTMSQHLVDVLTSRYEVREVVSRAAVVYLSTRNLPRAKLAREKRLNLIRSEMIELESLRMCALCPGFLRTPVRPLPADLELLRRCDVAIVYSPNAPEDDAAEDASVPVFRTAAAFLAWLRNDLGEQLADPFPINTNSRGAGE